MSILHKLNELGQSVWLDFISREIIDNGELALYIKNGISGVTSNPSIFKKAIADSETYDSEIKILSDSGLTAYDIYEKLAIEDIARAADLLKPIFEACNGADGFVSIEANPHLAFDTVGTVEEIIRLNGILHRPNVMFKVPGTKEGIVAIQELIAKGINVNVTLIFSVNYYIHIAEAYIKGLERLAATGGDVSKVASVASFFVSRIDNEADKELSKVSDNTLKGKIAVANAKLAYSKFRAIFKGDRWEKLASNGAKVQRVLWASTSTKNPEYSDTLYIDKLIGPDTVNTIPPDTLTAFEDHGMPEISVTKNLETELSRLDKLEDMGIEIDGITDKLLAGGVQKFIAAFDSLIESIESKSAQA